MLTKFILTVDGQEYELQPQDVVNWEDIECSYKRSDYSGVIRSFMSQFQFAENAYTLILDSYRQKGMSSCVSVAVLVIDNSWEYHEAFRCDMDMTTLSFTSTIATLTAVDNSVAAQIKANKSTKYEFKIGSDITPDVKTYRFDRLNMTETATYSITDGESQDDGSLYGIYKSKNNGRIYVGLINSELAIGGAVLCNDDQVYKDGHMLRALKKVNIKLEYSITVSIMRGCGTLTLMKNENVVKVLHEGCEQNKPWRERDFGSEEELMGYITSDAEIKTDWAQEKWDGKWVTINGIVWVCRNDAYHNGNWWDCTGETREQYISKASSGIVNISLEPGDEIWLRYSGSDKENFSIYKSELKFSWKVRGESVDIVNIEPIELLRRLLEKMGIDATYCSIEAQQHSFLSSVRLLPAEGIRGISDARITTSFNDFCTWLETVFGYVYEINKFGSVSFMHRDKLFNPHAEVHEISDARDFEYSIEKSVVYSSLVVGYNKQDYEGVNGRDEFNFSTSYTFDLPIDGKKLELKSPYRADSYGIEFLAEKRGKDTTDNSSDTCIFFVTAIDNGKDYYTTNRSSEIENSICGTLINSEYSPVSCVWANHSYLCMSAPEVTLKYASTEGNADIVIDGTGISEDLKLQRSGLTSGILKFSCSELSVPDNLNSIVRVANNGYEYEGFIKELSINFAKERAVEYQILVSKITPCI